MADALAPQVEALAVSGRDWGGLQMLDDLPSPGLGPLGGLASALCHARSEAFDAVLTAPCDTLGLPPDLVHRLGRPTAVAAEQWLVGLWAPEIGPRLAGWLRAGGSLAVRDWLATETVRTVRIVGLRNLNRPGDS